MTNQERICSLLPAPMAREIEGITRGRVGGGGALGEIRLTAFGRCSIVHKGQAFALRTLLSEEDISEIFRLVSGGSEYAHRETVKAGYIMMGGGVRVGISGRARYDRGELVGISEIKTLVFRLPINYCDFEDKLLRIYRRGIGCGMLIYSPPGYGKTTALRTLAKEISKSKRLVIVDERGELDIEDSGASVLTGYKKSLGIEIATRTHSPEILMIDEIGLEDVSPLLLSLKSGVPVIASVHARDFAELSEKAMLEPLLKNRVFSVFLGIGKWRGKYKLTRNKLEDIEKIDAKELVTI